VTLRSPGFCARFKRLCGRDGLWSPLRLHDPFIELQRDARELVFGASQDEIALLVAQFDGGFVPHSPAARPIAARLSIVTGNLRDPMTIEPFERLARWIVELRPARP